MDPVCYPCTTIVFSACSPLTFHAHVVVAPYVSHSHFVTCVSRQPIKFFPNSSPILPPKCTFVCVPIRDVSLEVYYTALFFVFVFVFLLVCRLGGDVAILGMV